MWWKQTRQTVACHWCGSEWMERWQEVYFLVPYSLDRKLGIQQRRTVVRAEKAPGQAALGTFGQYPGSHLLLGAVLSCSGNGNGSFSGLAALGVNNTPCLHAKFKGEIIDLSTNTCSGCGVFKRWIVLKDYIAVFACYIISVHRICRCNWYKQERR